MRKPKGLWKLRPYYCRHCGKTVLRKSDKAWITSYCDATGRNARLMRVVK